VVTWHHVPEPPSQRAESEPQSMRQTSESGRLFNAIGMFGLQTNQEGIVWACESGWDRMAMDAAEPCLTVDPRESP
jgi:hypothetical protein